MSQADRVTAHWKGDIDTIGVVCLPSWVAAYNLETRSDSEQTITVTAPRRFQQEQWTMVVRDDLDGVVHVIVQEEKGTRLLSARDIENMEVTVLVPSLDRQIGVKVAGL